MAITSHLPKGWVSERYSLLGLLGLLTAADEVCHADAQHRATSDPSEGHAVETGQRGAGIALLVLDGDGIPSSNASIELRSDHIRAGVTLSPVSSPVVSLYVASP